MIEMEKRGFCGCCSLHAGTLFTGVLAATYNASLIYWFFSALDTIHSNDDFFMVLTILLDVLMSLAGVHVTISLILVYGVVKEKPDLVMLWIVTYISSSLVVSGLFTVGLAFMLDKTFLYIILCNFLFIINIVMALRYYKEMVSNMKRDSV